MHYDPIDHSQQLMRRVGRLLRNNRIAADDGCPRRCLQGEARDWHFEKGREQVANMTAAIEAHTGSPLDMPRALDYGCGFGRLALPLAERCEHVYGLDISPEVLAEADRNAKRMQVSNVEWLGAERLAELSGRYDLVLSYWVFSHIPSREGERILATLVRGLRDGGVGAIHLTLRPDRPLAGLVGRQGSDVSARDPSGRLGRVNLTYPYLLMNSYSLNRLGVLLADAGVREWRVKWHGREGATGAAQVCPAAVIIFRKG
jgi:SAM-dependent methyltransferase